MIISLKLVGQVVKYWVQKNIFEGVVLAMHFLKACQYVTTNDFFLQRLEIYVCTKFAQGTCGSVIT